MVGIALFAAVLFALRHDYRRLESYKYLFGVAAVGLLALPALPVIGQTVNGARLWVAARAAPLPARRAREGAA